MANSLIHRRVGSGPCSWARSAAVFVGAVSFAFTSGCLDRTETIRIDSNGSVRITALFESDSQDEFHNGDAVPDAGTGWEVVERTIPKDDGSSRYQLAARQSFAPGEPLPDNFGRPGDMDRALYLQFPTTVDIEQRGDYRYFHFQRVYEPRTYAQFMAEVELIEERAQKMITQAKQENGESDDVVLPAGKEKQVVELYVQSAIKRLEAFAREAFRETNADTPPDAWLAAHEALKRLQVDIDYPQLIDMIERVGTEKNEELFKQLEDDFESAVLSTIQGALQGTGLVRNMSSFLRRYEEIKTAFRITEDLGDDAFEIRVELPGEIVASNADARNARELIWKFSGELVRDRRIELLATSRVRGD